MHTYLDVTTQSAVSQKQKRLGRVFVFLSKMSINSMLGFFVFEVGAVGCGLGMLSA